MNKWWLVTIPIAIFLASVIVTILEIVGTHGFYGIWINPVYLKYIMFGTKTGLSRNEFVNESIPSNDIRLVYLISRHGSRFPTEKYFGRIMHLRDKLDEAGSFYTKYINASLFTNSTFYAALTQFGAQQIFNEGDIFAKYMSKRKMNFDESNTEFFSSCTPRAVETMKAFGLGFFKGNWNKIPNSCKDDSTFRFYDYCNEYKANKIRLKVHESYMFRNYYYALIKSLVAEKLDLENFTSQDLGTVYQLCAFYKSVNDPNQKICGAFTKEMLAIMEYFTDSMTYFKLGPGFNISASMSSGFYLYILLQIQEKLKIFEDTGKSSFIGNFAHAETLLPFLDLLGLLHTYGKQTQYYNDSPLTFENMKNSFRGERYLRFGRIMPMGGNLIIFVTGNDPNYMIRFYLEGQEAYIPCCIEKNKERGSQSQFCTFMVFRVCFSNYVNPNLFDISCKNKT